MRKPLIDFMLENSGKLPKGMSWLDVANKFDIPLPNPKKNKDLPLEEKNKRRGRKANDIWRKWLTSEAGLKLVKQITENGKVKWETYKDVPKNEIKLNSDEFEVEKVTTNPYGGQWLKLKKKENFHTEAHLETLKNLLSKEIQPVQYEFEHKVNNKGLFIYGADKHIGALTKTNSIYTNNYDKLEMQFRIVNKTLQAIRESVALHGKMDSLFIMELGDALDGYDGKTTKGLKGLSPHSLPQQLNNREQHDTYVALHKQLFDCIVDDEYAENIYFIATSCSNHGGDFEYGAYRTLQTYLEVKYPFIKTFISSQFLNHFIYGNHCIIFSHGKDDEDMHKGLPLTLNDKVENYINDYITVNDLQKYNITVVSGDLHQSAETFGKNFRYRKVLSQYGGSKWIHTNFGSDAPGLSYEVYEAETNKVFKEDEIFDCVDKSNTGIKF
jgi:hypothetical protein